jgi:CBS domain-containing protein
MVTINEILKEKQGHVVYTVPQTASVLEATQLMNQHSIGALVVNDQERMIGIFTERDVLRRVVAEERPPAEVRVEEVMTTEVACCSPETTLDEARGVMKRHRIRHLPVLGEDGKLLGLVSIGDLNAYQASDQESTIHYLHEYLYGRV